MTWQELVEDQIDKLEKEKNGERERLNKEMERVGARNFANTVEIVANIKSIEETIFTLRLLLRRQDEVTE